MLWAYSILAAIKAPLVKSVSIATTVANTMTTLGPAAVSIYLFIMYFYILSYYFIYFAKYL